MAIRIFNHNSHTRIRAMCMYICLLSEIIHIDTETNYIKTCLLADD